MFLRKKLFKSCRKVKTFKKYLKPQYMCFEKSLVYLFMGSLYKLNSFIA